MQVYAFEENVLISPANANKGKVYLCPECLSKVRLKRRGVSQPYFSHLKKNRKCKLSQKKIIDLKLQWHIQNLFEEAETEKSFPEIGRISDVTSARSKLIFEVQRSFISLSEAEELCADYESLGYQVIWILHDRYFNKRKTLPVEKFLRKKNCYYSNMDKRGRGIIYDQINQKTLATPVNLKICKSLPPHKWPEILADRAQNWPLYHEGDLLDLALKGEPIPHCSLRKQSPLTFFKNLYLIWLQAALKKNSF